MATKTVISFTLDTASIDNAIREIDNYRNDLEKKIIPEFLKKFAAHGVEYAIGEIANLGAVDTGELSDSIVALFPDLNVAVIRASAYYACYVEYGTGVVGKYMSHPSPPEGWEYDYNNHDLKGWFYINHDRDGKLHWTMGTEARPFMYHTYQHMRTIAEDYAKRYL